MSPDSENGRERGRALWAAEGRANGQQVLVALDGSLRYRTGECWLSVRGSASGKQGKQGGTAESNFTDPVLVDEHTGTGSFFIAKTRPAKGAGLFYLKFMGRPLRERSLLL